MPIDRTDADAAQAALTTAERILAEGKLLGMYPEGTRSPDGRLYKGKTGLARLALETGVPVIPVAMIGTDSVNPPGSKMWRFGRVQVKFGKPMDFTPLRGAGGQPVHRARRHRRGDVRADADCPARSTSTCTPPTSRRAKAEGDGKPPARIPDAAAG